MYIHSWILSAPPIELELGLPSFTQYTSQADHLVNCYQQPCVLSLNLRLWPVLSVILLEHLAMKGVHS